MQRVKCEVKATREMLGALVSEPDCGRFGDSELDIGVDVRVTACCVSTVMSW